jgi:hypothetical protein
MLSIYPFTVDNKRVEEYPSLLRTDKNKEVDGEEEIKYNY